MKKQNLARMRFKTLLMISFVVLTSINLIVPFFNEKELNNSEIISDDMNNENDLNIDLNPNPSIVGTHPWWNSAFRSRQLINITNPYSVSFENFAASISFNYSELLSEGKINSSLKDIRIVEYDAADNPHLRKYYYLQDYPQQEFVTVWFDTNVSASTTEFDTYIYFGTLKH